MTDYADSWPDMTADASETTFKDSCQVKGDRKTGSRNRSCLEGYLQGYVYLGNEDTGDAVRIVPFWVGWSKQLLTFTLFKTMQECWIEDVLEHL